MAVQAHAAALVIMVMLVSPVLGCSPNGRSCKDCIVNQMKHSCPSCSPILHCMARCLWGGTSRSVYIKKRDCNDATQHSLTAKDACRSASVAVELETKYFIQNFRALFHAYSVLCLS